MPTLISPTTLDLVFAAHIHMLRVHQPDMLLANLLSESYHTLLAHCDRVLGKTFRDSTAFPSTVTASRSFSFRSILPHIPSPAKEKAKLGSPTWAKQERKFRLMRWAFFGTVGLAFGSYIYFAGIIPMYLRAVETVRLAMQEGELDDDDEEDEEGES